MPDDDLAAAPARRQVRVAGLRAQCTAAGVDLAGLAGVVDAITAVLFAHDPAGAAQSGRADEYAPEAETIALQLHQVDSETDLATLVRSELSWWFSPETGRPAKIHAIATELWALRLES